MRIILIATIAAALAGTAPGESAASQIVLPAPDSERGRFLFASKGCVVCHSINGVGGGAGPALDASAEDLPIDPLNFAARMWRGAESMAVLQAMEFGYQIEISGEDIAHLAAFVADGALQREFSEKDVPELLRGWTIDEPFPDLGEDWSAWMPGGAGDPEADADFGIGNMTRGYLLAERWCTTCHVIDREGEGGNVGPAFEEVAARPEMTVQAIEAWLSVPHSAMPEFLNLREADFQDLAAYILSLQP